MLAYRATARKIFFWALPAGGLATVLVVFLFWQLARYSKIIFTALPPRLDKICGCAEHLSFVSHPLFFTGFSIILLLAAAYLVFALVKFLSFVVSDFRFKRQYKSNWRPLDVRWQGLLVELGLEGRVLMTEAADALVFCFGWRPQIIISHYLLEKLTPAELKIILAHEKSHLQLGDSWKNLILRSLSDVFFFLPVFKYLARQYSVYAELAADAAATNNFQDRRGLIGVLEKVVGLKEKIIWREGLRTSFFSPLTERVNQLADINYQPRFRFGRRWLVITLFVPLGLLFGVYFISSNLNNYSALPLAPACVKSEAVFVEHCPWAPKPECAVGRAYLKSDCSPWQ